MGISYATFGAALGIPVTLAIPSNASRERLTILHALGAEVIQTDAGEGIDGAILEARRLASEFPHRYWYAHQYDNPSNWQAHYKTTGPEIFDQTGGNLTHFVTGLGTSGTLMGAGRYLREKVPSVRLVGVQPDASFHGLEGLKHMQSAIKPGIFDESLPDEILEVRTELAYEMVLKLARSEGLFVGISSGAAALGALQIAERLQAGVVVTLFPDSGYKYLSEHELWTGT
jgi:cysteine synthase B